jgi:hypothetical protein
MMTERMTSAPRIWDRRGYLMVSHLAASQIRYRIIMFLLHWEDGHLTLPDLAQRSGVDLRVLQGVVLDHGDISYADAAKVFDALDLTLYITAQATELKEETPTGRNTVVELQADKELQKLLDDGGKERLGM